MDLSAVHTLYDVLEGDRFDLIYSGRFHDEHTPGLIALGEGSIIGGAEDRGHRQRLSFVMVEAYQNIVRHRAKLTPSMDSGAGRSLFALRCKAAGDEVIAIDPVAKEEVGDLDHVLGRIGGSDLGQLKELFLDRLRDGARSARGGAGLGLIEMARRSGNGLRHALLPLDASTQLFVLQVMIGAPAANATSVERIMRMHTAVRECDLLVLSRVGVSAAAMEAVLQMIHKDVEDGSPVSTGLTRAFLAAADWLHTIAVGTSSSILLGRDPGGYALVFAATFDQDRVERWVDELDRIGLLSKGELERHYRDGLLGRTNNGSFTTDLLELARLSSAPLRHAAFPSMNGTCLVVEALIKR